MTKGIATDADGYAVKQSGTRHREISWDDLRFVLAVAETTSLKQAAEKLSTEQTTVGRRIDRVENAIGQDLFARTSSGTTPTQQGRRVIEELRRASLHINRAIDQLLAPDESAGEIKIGIPDGLASYWLTQFIPWVATTYPRVTVRLFSQDKIIENRTDIYDCQVQLMQPSGTASDLTRRVATLHYIPYAGRSYVEKYGLPETRDDLVKHRLIDFSGYLLDKGNWINWAGEERIAKNPALLATSSGVLLESVRAGAGIALIPTYLSCRYDDLVPCNLGIYAAANVYILFKEESRENWPGQVAVELLARAFDSKRMPWFDAQFIEPSSFREIWERYSSGEPDALAAE